MYSGNYKSIEVCTFVRIEVGLCTVFGYLFYTIILNMIYYIFYNCIMPQCVLVRAINVDKSHCRNIN